MLQSNPCDVVPEGFHHICRRETRSRARGIAPIHKLRNTRRKIKKKTQSTLDFAAYELPKDEKSH